MICVREFGEREAAISVPYGVGIGPEGIRLIVTNNSVHLGKTPQEALEMLRWAITELESLPQEGD